MEGSSSCCGVLDLVQVIKAVGTENEVVWWLLFQTDTDSSYLKGRSLLQLSCFAVAPLYTDNSRT